MNTVRCVAGLLGMLLAAGCAAPERVAPASVVVEPGTDCRTAGFIVDDAFDGARRGRCTPVGGDGVLLEITPEDDGVANPSPWYAFRITPRRPGRAEIVLDYGEWPHRYAPKISTDGETWRPLDASQVTVSPGGHRARVEVALTGLPVWIAAQELITAEDVSDWAHRLASRSAAGISLAGRSALGKPVYLLESGDDLPALVLLVGRQHPPEVSGSVAMAAFVETLFADTPHARAFREHTGLVVVPMLNPDGVDGGYWRHNTGGRDLNRDWGPFEEPETKLIQALLEEFDREGRTVRLFVDFHSTDRNLFYTQPESDPTRPANFTRRWFERVRARLTHYDFSDEPRPQSDTPNGKNYMYRRYGIPSITYEVGDETDRDAAREAARIFAEELMTLLRASG